MELSYILIIVTLTPGVTCYYMITTNFYRMVVKDYGIPGAVIVQNPVSLLICSSHMLINNGYISFNYQGHGAKCSLSKNVVDLCNRGSYERQIGVRYYTKKMSFRGENSAPPPLHTYTHVGGSVGQVEDVWCVRGYTTLTQFLRMPLLTLSS
jgi:hypothetical protein